MLPFHLNILPLEKLIPVEKTISSKIPEIRRELDRTGYQANPLLAIKEDADRYLLLNGSNCFEAMRTLGIRNVIVQEIPEESDQCRFLSWYHLVGNFSVEYLKGLSEVLNCSLEEVDYDTIWDHDDHPVSLTCTFLDGRSFRLIPKSENLIDRVSCLNSFIEAYQSFSTHMKIYPDRIFIESSEIFNLGSALILLPCFGYSQISELARAEVLFPPDCLNIYAENRVVGLDFPLQVLNSKVDIEEKKEFLRELLRFRMQSDRSTVYGGRVYFMGKSRHQKVRRPEPKEIKSSDTELYLE